MARWYKIKPENFKEQMQALKDLYGTGVAFAREQKEKRDTAAQIKPESIFIDNFKQKKPGSLK